MTKLELRILRYLQKHPEIEEIGLYTFDGTANATRNRYCVQDLKKQHVIEPITPGSTRLKLNRFGIAALEEKTRFVWSEFRAWFTLAIAVAAFIKSFFFF